jgi:RND family efflux transporter MFP subunit
VDLEKLKIDRSQSARAAPRRRRVGLLPWVLLLALILAVVLFRAPLLAAIDRVRLPAVSVTRVVKSSAAEVGAVAGTAANGYVVAARRAALSADTPGRIVEMNVTEGSVVKRGDVVARLYDDEYEALLAKAEADLATGGTAVAEAEERLGAAELERDRLASQLQAARARLAAAQARRQWDELELERFTALVAEGVAAQRDADRARTEQAAGQAEVQAASAELVAAEAAAAAGQQQVELARAGLDVATAALAPLAASRELAQATLDKTLVRAPFDGVVVLKDAEVGEVVSPNVQGGSSARGSVVTMVDFASLEAQAKVPETIISSVAVGAPASIFLDAYPESRYRGAVARIWPTANRSDGTVEVRVSFDAPDGRLRPEMGARVVFERGGDAAPEVPATPRILIQESSLVVIDGATGVFRLDRDVARFAPVEVGERKGGRAEILGGLAEGEQIVANPPVSLKDGDRVQLARGP